MDEIEQAEIEYKIQFYKEAINECDNLLSIGDDRVMVKTCSMLPYYGLNDDFKSFADTLRLKVALWKTEGEKLLEETKQQLA